MKKIRHENYELRFVKDHLNYNPDTGVFMWTTDRKRVKRGDIAGSLDKDGYVIIHFNKKLYKAHRLAWFFVYDLFPEETIDHKNRIRNDNRICNLRSATQLEQMHNLNLSKANKSGFPGVYWSRKKNKWQAQISINHKRYHVGLFEDASEAARKRTEMKEALMQSL